MTYTNKLVPYEDLAAWRDRHTPPVLTNGCFDLLHLGHVQSLQWAAQQGNLLLVGVNSDLSCRILKGEGRPIIPEQERALMLAALECVDYVTIFPEQTVVELIGRARPGVWCKGAQYSKDTLAQTEVIAANKCWCHIRFAPMTPHSTTQLIDRIRAGSSTGQNHVVTPIPAIPVQVGACPPTIG